MDQDVLFEGADEVVEAPKDAAAAGAARLRKANRDQGLLSAICIDDLVPTDHRARSFWLLLESIDLSGFEEGIKARTRSVGRSSTDPCVLLCLWLYATSEGIGSARHLARLCTRDAPYRWICGGLTPNYHTLSDFRIKHGKALDDLLTKILVGLVRSGAVRLRRVSQDGTKVRASAGAASFRRERSLREIEKQVQRQVSEMKEQLDAPARDESKRKKAAQKRALHEREQRIQKALEAIEELRQGSQKAKDPAEVRASTTDPDARIMKMADGGYRPAINVQSAVDTETRLIVGISLNNKGSDLNEMVPMLEDVERRTGELPKEYLVDGGYAKKEAVEVAGERDVAVYAPAPKSRGKDQLAPPRAGDGPGVAAWRERMATEDAKEIYKERAATAETVFADWRRWRGLKQMPVRGLERTTCIALLMGLTYNFIRLLELGIQL